MKRPGKVVGSRYEPNGKTGRLKATRMMIEVMRQKVGVVALSGLGGSRLGGPTYLMDRSVQRSRSVAERRVEVVKVSSQVVKCDVSER